MLKINKNPSRKELAWFGLLFLAFFGLIGLIVWRRTDSLRTAEIIWAAAAGVTLVYYALPPLRRWIYLGWLYASYPIGWVVSHVLLAIIFYLIITPIGLIMRLCGRDPMQRKLDPSAGTYWIKRHPTTDARRYFRQF